MCPPSDPAERDAASPEPKPARGRVPPPPDVGPRTELVPSSPDRTVVTRRPRTNHRASEPHELLPTLRMPPVEARAMRRQAQAEVEGTDEDGSLTLNSGDIELDVVDASPSRPKPEAREPLPTVRLSAIPVETPQLRTALPAVPAQARLHRPPLPMPDVLRSGPKSSSRQGATAPPLEPPSGVTPHAVPEAIVTIDTASLVLEVAESLAPTTAPVAVEPETPDASVEVVAAAESGEAVAPAPHAALVVERPLLLAPAPSRTNRAAWFIGVAASLVLGVWWLAPTSSMQPETQSQSALTPAGEQLAFVAPSTPSEPVTQAPGRRTIEAATPVPAIEPEPDVDVEPELSPLMPDAMMLEDYGAESPDPIDAPIPTAPIAIGPGTTPAPAPIVVATTAAASAPAAKPATKASKHKSKKPPSESKVAAPPPPPVAKAPVVTDPTALLRDAEKAFAEGRYATAMRSAQRSLAGRNDPRATRIVVLSACKLKREDVATNNFNKLPLGQRRGVRNSCKDSGIKI